MAATNKVETMRNPIFYYW